MDEPWRKQQYSASPPPPSSSFKPLQRSFSQQSSSATARFPLPRSYSLKNAPAAASSSSSYHGASTSHNNPSSSFYRSISVKGTSSCTSRSSPTSQKGSGLGSGSNVARKYSSLAKEQKARFYIIRRKMVAETTNQPTKH
ncbi:hypothetical protein SAY86_008984 [Trapa natans]|uniref:Uncharacterized protein n=1 Tax=Trapa natans TaxID=22666 RepID=A0AAN7QBL4_TRANT|nr:hypothetical protein SAY86_008984 [Trapa natans]